MRKPTIKHENLRKAIGELLEFEDEVDVHVLLKVIRELKHSCLLMPLSDERDHFNITVIESDEGDFGLVYTDMDEFRKTFPDYRVEAGDYPFEVYMNFVFKSNLAGLILNVDSECFKIPKALLKEIDYMPQNTFDTTNSYIPEELFSLKSQINNETLERFIENPKNTGRYEELFEEISKSTLFNLMLSRDDLTDYIENGMIDMTKTGPLAFLHTVNLGDEYATVFTSEVKLSHVQTNLSRYTQIVNFSQLVNFTLNDDMAGIIINPDDENIVLTRDVLLEYYRLIEEKCNNEKLNKSLFFLFEIEVEK